MMPAPASTLRMPVGTPRKRSPETAGPQPWPKLQGRPDVPPGVFGRRCGSFFDGSEDSVSGATPRLRSSRCTYGSCRERCHQHVVFDGARGEFWDLIIALDTLTLINPKKERRFSRRVLPILEVLCRSLLLCAKSGRHVKWPKRFRILRLQN